MVVPSMGILVEVVKPYRVHHAQATSSYILAHVACCVSSLFSQSVCAEVPAFTLSAVRSGGPKKTWLVLAAAESADQVKRAEQKLSAMQFFLNIPSPSSVPFVRRERSSGDCFKRTEKCKSC